MKLVNVLWGGNSLLVIVVVGVGLVGLVVVRSLKNYGVFVVVLELCS